MTKKQKRNLKRIIISLSLFLIVLITNLILKYGFNDKFEYGLASAIPSDRIGWLLPFGLYFIIYLYIGHDVLRKSAINISHGQIFDENFLMSVATIGAFGLGLYMGIAGTSENGVITYNNAEGFDEACAVLLFYQVGEWFQSYAAGKSRKSITALMDIRPDYANLKQDDGSVIMVDPVDVMVGSIIVVKPGEKIPLDGIIRIGKSTLDTKALTGESLPLDVEEGMDVISGTVNLTSTIEIETTKDFGESTVSKILDLVENASSHKSKSEAFISKFAKYYTPVVVIAALLLAVIPPLIIGFTGNWNTWTIWIYRALSFLVVSCPCALVISVPMSFFAGLGGASKNGILIKGSIHLERFNNANVFVFDKTGTLTKGNFNVEKIYPSDKEDEILRLAAIAERDSSHPIAKSIVNRYGKEIISDYVLENIAGKGIKGEHNNDVILAGNAKLMELFNIDYLKANETGTIVYVAHNNSFIGYIVIADEIKSEALTTIDYLNSIGARTVMLTGDNENIARHVAEKLHLTEFKAGLLPGNKVEEVDKLLNEKKDNELLCFVGDGINDAPVIMKADIGIAMGGVGSDAAIEASDIVLMHDNLDSLRIAKKIARKTMRIVYENIIFALAVKIIILILSAFGITNMWFAVFGDVGVAVICILNAMRANVKNYGDNSQNSPKESK
ncbi:MAG: cadmium-translocating P-type ATPase [Acholeplasmatales bacterium]|nr:cadmium-translocating P-type ATPase [Acholeplasmatales bacterium]